MCQVDNEAIRPAFRADGTPGVDVVVFAVAFVPPGGVVAPILCDTGGARQHGHAQPEMLFHVASDFQWPVGPQLGGDPRQALVFVRLDFDRLAFFRPAVPSGPGRDDAVNI